MDIQDELHQMLTEHEEEDSEEELVLDNHTLQTVMAGSGIPDTIAHVIEEAYQSEFAKEPPIVDSLIDKKIIAENEKRHQQKAMTDQVLALQTTIEEKEAAIEEKDTVIKQQSQELSIVSSPELSQQSAIDVVVKVKADHASKVTKKVVDGKTCLVIPVEDNFHIKINGVDKDISEFSD